MADFLKVDEILNDLNLEEDMAGAEFGCGAGMFAIALARKLNKGRVYALDIQEEKLSALKGKITLEKITNVSLILCDLEDVKGSTLKNDSLDIILIPNVLFQSENKNVIIKEAERILKSGGQLLVIDWLRPNPFVPQQSLVNPDAIKETAKNLGLSLKKEFAAGDYHYGLLFVK